MDFSQETSWNQPPHYYFQYNEAIVIR